MAIEQGGTKYGLTINTYKPGSNNKVSKNIDYLNLKDDSLGSGYDDSAVYNFGKACAVSLMGGETTLLSIGRKAEYELTEEV